MPAIDRASFETHRPSLICENSAEFDAAMEKARPGDVVLKWNDSSALNKVIHGYQASIGFTEQSCSISHVAIYAAPNRVIHARKSSITSPGTWEVGEDNLLEYFKGFQISFVRPVDLSESAVRKNIVATARSRIGDPFDARRLVATISPRLYNMIGAISEEQARNFISHGTWCSKFAFESFLGVMGADCPLLKPGISNRGPVRVPAEFFANPAIANVI